MATHRWTDIKSATLTPERRERTRRKAQAMALEMDLAELRAEAGKTQPEVADAADIAQSEVSRIEHRDDHLLSTLRRYVKALGGDLEVVAVLGNKRITLRGV